MIKLYTTNGKEVLTGPITGSEHILNTAMLSSGIYLLEIYTENKTAMHKIVIQK